MKEQEISIEHLKPSPKSFDLLIDPKLFREQRRMLLVFQNQLLQQIDSAKDKDSAAIKVLQKHEELMEGLINLTDSIADQAFDRYNLNSLLTADEPFDQKEH